MDGQSYQATDDDVAPDLPAHRFVASIKFDHRDPITGQRTDLLPDATGFAVHPGRGCEAATFGLARVPPEDDEGNPVHGLPLVWRWHSTCKTQYASVVSDEHLIHCHTSLVALLEEAERLGFQVTVGAMYDAIGDRARVDGAIFKYPDFEELETRAVNRDPPR